MHPLTPQDIHGVWGTLLLPLRTDGAIDWAQMENHLETLVASGLHGLYVHGTAGEFHTLTLEEFDQINVLLADRCERAGMPFQIGATHPCAHETLERISRSAPYAPGALQIILPDWLPLSHEETADYLKSAAEFANPVPLVLYSPPHAKTEMPPEQLGRLLDEVPSLVGVKVAGGDAEWYSRMHRATHRGKELRCSVFVAGHHLATGLRHGAQGSYSNIAALSPRGALAWHRLMLQDPETADDIEERILRFFGRHIRPLQKAGFSNPALDKFLAVVGNWSDMSTQVRWPHRVVPEKAVPTARQDAHALLPELFPA